MLKDAKKISISFLARELKSWPLAACFTFMCAIATIFSFFALFFSAGTAEREIRRKADVKIMDGRKKIPGRNASAKNSSGFSASIRRPSTPLHTVVDGAAHVPSGASSNDMMAYIDSFVKNSSQSVSRPGQAPPVMSFNPVFTSMPSMEKTGESRRFYAESAMNDLDLDSFGRPLRWLPAASQLFSYTPRAWKHDDEMRAIPDEVKKTMLGARRYGSGEHHYTRLIDEFSSRFNLDRALVYAIVHSESNFSPHLVSRKSAMGLMQLMPSTASGEVHRFLYGRTGAINYEQLRIPEINIRYGTAYLHILFTRYFSKVTDARSREYCAVAAYNMGPNGFLKIYGKNQEEAIANINSMTPDELFASFAYRLPQKETRSYVIKVRNAKLRYMAQQ